ncbi:MAG: D-glycero-beta-D-manno-heptose 1,7-bisphosphate 7-phosphatase [Pseudohongiellaceae bacterium]
MTTRRLLVLDRDGVINEDRDDFVKSVEEWIPVPGAISAIARLSRAGYTIAVATNQSGLARGLFSEDDLMAMHQLLFDAVAAEGGTLDALFYCPHGPDEGCDCRKPAPGLLYQIEENLDIPLRGSPFVGDSLRDLEAAVRAGCQPILVRTGKGWQTAAQGIDSLPVGTQVYDSLADYADTLLEEAPR